MNIRAFERSVIAGILLLFHGAVFAQIGNIVPITVRHVANVAVDTFGFHSCATYCIDPDLGESELPPKPPAGVFDTRFVDSRDGSACLGQGVRLHLQFEEFGIDTFQLAFQKGDPVGVNTWSVSWPAGLGSFWNSLRLTDALGLGIVDVDMLAETSVTIAQSFITSVNIIGRGPIPFNIIGSGFQGPCGDAVGPEVPLLPARFSLEQNYPNPFNPSTTVTFAVPTAAFADVAVYDLLGRRIAGLASEVLTPGIHTRTWSGADERGIPAPSGVYYLRMTAQAEHGPQFIANRKLLLMK